MINPQSDRPVFRQLADLLRDRITGGELQPGDQLPGYPLLAEEFKVSTTTARQALSLLVNEGLVETRVGKGTFVRSPVPVRRLSSERYAAVLEEIEDGKVPQSAFVRDYGVAPEDVGVANVEFTEVTVDARTAALLQVEPGTKVFRRQMVQLAAGNPERIRVSHFPLDLVASTPMTDPARQPWPGGVIAELAALGIRPRSVDEDVAIRMPTPDESYVLRIPGGTPVFVITRVGRDQHRVIEVAEMVLPGDRVVLHYHLDL